MARDKTTPYAGFGGTVETTFARSGPDWPDQPTAPDRAPNVVLILVDDLGYSDLGCYGSEIATPNIDALAADGVRYSNFHVNPMCSPTRAALLTGLNAHDAGVGFVAECDPGFPGYAGEITQNASTLAEIFRDSGYSTYMVGKWHLCKPQDRSPGGNRSSWPVQRGFDDFYGILNGFTNFFHPDRLIDGNRLVDVDRYPDDYYLTDDLTDRAIQMVRESATANPDKPFFMYFAHPAVHAPLHAKATDIGRQKGNYDGGWDAIRATRFARQKELGILPEAELAPRNHEKDHDVEPWTDLHPDVQALYARYMEVYAAMVTNVDENVGRFLGELASLGELDNTIVFFTSDNGASREGEATGSTQYFQILPPAMTPNVERDRAVIDAIGGPTTMPHYPRGWAMACNTPLRLYKTHTHAGGHQVPMIMRWPASIPGGEVRTQYAHVTDVLPTLLDLTGVKRAPERNGRAMKPIAGQSFVPSLTEPEAPISHTQQYYENAGSRALYRDGWEAVTVRYPLTNFSDEEWELFNIDADPSQVHDLAAVHPERLAELQAAWEADAHRFQVYPLDEGSWLKFMQRPAEIAGLDAPITVTPGTPTLDGWRSGRLVQMRSFDVVISLDFSPGDQGVLVSHGDQGGGYLAYVEDDSIFYVDNGFGDMHTIEGGKLTAGPHEVVISQTVASDRQRNVRILVDGDEAGAGGAFPGFAGIAPFQGIDVGIDRRSPVCWDLAERHGSFAYTGKLHNARWEPGDPVNGSNAELVAMLTKMGERYD